MWTAKKKITEKNDVENFSSEILNKFACKINIFYKFIAGIQQYLKNVVVFSEYSFID